MCIRDSTSSDQLLIKNSNIKQTGSGNNPILLITPEEDVSARTATISVFIDDGNGGYAEDAFDVYILPVNDAPLSGDFEKSAYVYDVIEFTQSDFPFSDLDDVLSTSSSFDKIEIITLPTKGDLKYNDESITAITSIPFDQIDKLSFELPEGLTATDSFTFRKT